MFVRACVCVLWVKHTEGEREAHRGTHTHTHTLSLCLCLSLSVSLSAPHFSVDGSERLDEEEDGFVCRERKVQPVLSQMQTVAGKAQ